MKSLLLADSRRTVTVNVEVVDPVDFKDVAYEHLVADKRHKHILLSLVESQRQLSDIHEDPIPEKGALAVFEGRHSFTHFPKERDCWSFSVGHQALGKL